MTSGSFDLSPLGAVCAGGACFACDAAGPPRWRRFGGRTSRGRRCCSPRWRASGQVGDGARPSPSGVDAPSGGEAAAGALPVSNGVNDRGAPYGAADGRLLEGASGADDGLPSFSPIDEEPANPAGPDEAVLGTAAVHSACGEGVTARGRDLPLLADADGGQEEGGRIDVTRSPGAGAGGFPPCAGATGAGAQPHGVVSPPATTVFGGGIGVAAAAGAGGNANIAHSVGISDSDNDLGVSTPAAAATDGMAAAEGPGDAPSPPGFGGALQ